MTTGPSTTPSRRQFLALLGAAGAALAAAGCSTGSGASGAARSQEAGQGGGKSAGGKLVWWDQLKPEEKLQRKTFDAFTAAGGPAVDYTVYNPDDLAKALPLAFNSKQMPDVFTIATLSAPTTVLLSNKWFSPLADQDTILKGLPDGTIVDGIHRFDGKLYSFPVFSFRQYDFLLWSNRSILQKAGIDPQAPLNSWDDVRAAARKVQKSGTAGMLLPVKFAARMAGSVQQLAQAAGFPGVQDLARGDGLNLKTGEFAYDDDTYVQAIDFLLSFQKDGTLFPSSSSLDARAGRARWAAGASGYFFDGSWNVGVIGQDFKSFLDQLVVGRIPTPDGKEPVLAHSPKAGTFWVSSQSQQVDQASQLLQLFARKDYQSGLAEAMDGPPLDLDAVADSNAHETFKQAMKMFKDQVFLGPSPEARNPKVSAVIGAMADVQPDLGAIVQGAFSGQVKDVKGALAKLSDDTNAAREAAIAKVGNGVTAADWKFDNWTPGTDYSTDKYKS